MKKTSFVLGITGIVLAGFLIAMVTARGWASPSLQGQITTSGSVINFQGQLNDSNGNPVPSGPYTMQFTICENSNCGATSWGPFSGSVNVEAQGLFSTLLGDVANGGIGDALSADVFTGDRWLKVEVWNGSAWEWMNPNQPITSAAIALVSVGNIRKDTVDTSTAYSDDYILTVNNTNSSESGLPSGGLHAIAHADPTMWPLPVGAGVYGEGYYGIYGSAIPNGDGVHGVANGTVAYGVYGYSDYGNGVRGESSGGEGVLARISQTPGVTPGNIILGEYEEGEQTITRFRLSADGTASLWGDWYVYGMKSAVVDTSQGQRALYSMESPEIWFEDFGSGILVNGQATVIIDPLFAETVVKGHAVCSKSPQFRPD